KKLASLPIVLEVHPRKLWQRLALNLPADGKTARMIKKFRSEIAARLYPRENGSTFVIGGIGAKAFRTEGWSPDAVFHAALNLAYFRQFGRMPVVGNFINLRTIRHGDIWRYISTTPEMHDFVRSPTRATLTAAMDRHRALIKEQK